MRKRISNNIIFYIFIAILALTQLLFLFFSLSNTSIANDDMCQLEVSISDSLPRILELLLETDNNPPLFTLLAALWVRIVPFGSGWLKLLNQIFLVSSTVIMALYTQKISGFISGIVTGVFTASSTILIYCCANVYRPYGLLFLTGTLSLIAYLNRRSLSDNTISLFVYGIAITLMAYTHYFGILTCLALFLFDIFLFIKKRIKLYCILPYFAAGLLYLPWLIPVVRTKLATAGSFWPTVPGFINLYTNCYNKYFDSTINIVLFIIFLILLFIQQKETMRHLRQTKVHPEDSIPHELTNEISFSFENLLLCLWVPFCVTIIDFIYSGIINPKGSMWVERYFIVVYPFSFILIGVSIQFLMNYLNKKLEYTLWSYIPYIVLSLYLALQGYQFISTCSYMSYQNQQPFEQACSFLAEQPDFFSETTAYLPTFNHEKKAYHYFFSKHDTVAVPTINWLKYPLSEDDSIEKYSIIYLQTISADIDAETLEYLDKNYSMVFENKELNISKWEKNNTSIQ